MESQTTTTHFCHDGIFDYFIYNNALVFLITKVLVKNSKIKRFDNFMQKKKFFPIYLIIYVSDLKYK